MSRPAWLVRDGEVLASLEVAESLRGRTRGLLGRDGIEGALLLRPARSVHTFGMRFAIDVAFCDRDLHVLRVVRLEPNRVTAPVRRAHAVIEVEAGVLARWGVRAGDRLEVRDADPAGPDGNADGAGATAGDGAGDGVGDGAGDRPGDGADRGPGG